MMMKKNIRGFILIVSLFAGCFSVQAQKNIAEATFVYDIKGQALTGASTTGHGVPDSAPAGAVATTTTRSTGASVRAGNGLGRLPMDWSRCTH